MTAIEISLAAMAAALALISLGGGLYEYSVVDPAWPARPDLIQPRRGGVSRRRFWIPAHVAFEISLIAALVMSWPHADVRAWLLVGLASHAVMRVWSAFDFIPKALRFERSDHCANLTLEARRWARRSLWRFPLDLTTCGAMLAALVAAATTG